MWTRERPASLGPWPWGPRTFVATTTESRLPLTARPTTCSDCPAVYTLAVSMKLLPASRKASMILRASCSSHGASEVFPNIMAPRQFRDTFSPDLPMRTYSTAEPPQTLEAGGEGYRPSTISRPRRTPGGGVLDN